MQGESPEAFAEQRFTETSRQLGKFAPPTRLNDKNVAPQAADALHQSPPSLTLVAEPDPLDHDLVRSFAAGDLEGCARCFVRFGPVVEQQLRIRGVPGQDIEDAMQTAWMRAHSKLSREQETPPKDFAAWLTTIAINAYIDERRRTKRTKLWQEPPEADQEEESSDGTRVGSFSAVGREPESKARTRPADFESKAVIVFEAIRIAGGAENGPRLEKWWRARTSGTGMTAGEAAHLIEEDPSEMSKLWYRARPRAEAYLKSRGIDSDYLSEADGVQQ